jgi:hypothetical protein
MSTLISATDLDWNRTDVGYLSHVNQRMVSYLFGYLEFVSLTDLPRRSSLFTPVLLPYGARSYNMPRVGGPLWSLRALSIYQGLRAMSSDTNMLVFELC